MSEISPKHDWIPDDELTELADQNREYLERKYAADVAVLRAQVCIELDKHDAFHDGFGWALYHVESGPAPQEGLREVLIYVTKDTKKDVAKPADVRFFVNQLFKSDEGKANYFTQDVSVDDEDDAQYMPGIAEVKPDGTLSGRHGLSPVFIVRGGQLSIYFATASTPWDTYKYTVNGLRECSITPFGHYSNLHDRVFALEKAESIFLETRGLNPVSTNVGK